MKIGLEKRVSLDVSRQSVPDFVFKEFTMRELPYYFIHKFEEGYDFWLDGFYVGYPNILPPNGASAKLLKLMVEFVRDVRSRTLQNDRYPASLVSTPAGAGLFPLIYAAPRFTYVKYNEPYVNAETLRAKFTWKVIPTDPIDVQVIMIGYKIPENSLDMWR